MIQELQAGGRDDILAFLHKDAALDKGEAQFCVEKSDRVLAVRGEGGALAGCGTYRLWGKERDCADVYLYVAPDARGAGRGKTLLRALTADTGALSFVSTKIETNHAPSLRFFADAGFVAWYDELILCHNGAPLPQCDLALTAYKTTDFEAYVAALRESFFALRSANDFKPYFCCEPDEAKRDELERNREKLFVLRDGDAIAASVLVDGGFIEDVFVAPVYQGRGYGRGLMRFAVNRVLQSGAGPARLSAIAWNKRALSLYESCGFHVEKTMHYLRKF